MVRLVINGSSACNMVCTSVFGRGLHAMQERGVLSANNLPIFSKGINGPRIVMQMGGERHVVFGTQYTLEERTADRHVRESGRKIVPAKCEAGKSKCPTGNREVQIRFF